ncbi:MAG: hypothetical protein AAF682_27415 [Planctomycetota bacterium]
MVKPVAALLLTGLLPPPAPAQEAPAPAWSERSDAVEVLEGPVLLHADVFTQWGGHTFAYLLEGERHVYWAGIESYAGPALLGRVPKPGVGGDAIVARVPLEGDFERVNPPQIVRTPDEHVHVFLTTRPAGEGSGDIHYWRTAEPGDVGRLVDRSHLLPRTRFADFTIRQNVGVSRDGRRIVFCNLTDFVAGKHLMNTPLAWIGERDGDDFRFREPVVYGEQTAFFYPQVAATDEGPVLVGAVHREPNRNAELVHLDWDGRVLLWQALPLVEGESWAFDLQPLERGDWSRLALARLRLPREGSVRGVELWTYDAKTRELELGRAFANDLAREPSFASAGKLWLVPGEPAVFLNEPGSRRVVAWSGDLLGRGEVRLAPLPRTDAEALGYPQIRSLFFPSVLQGSFVDDGRVRPMAVDVSRPGLDRERDGDRCAFLLYWLRRRR